MMVRSRNFFILVLILLLGGIFVLLAEYFYEIDPNQLIACPEEAAQQIEPCEEEVEPPQDTEPDLIACTADAMQCPDGSYVGRTGPDCEFAACPDVAPDIVVSSFEDCVAAGNPVMESYPRQCNHNGEHFVEEISEPIQSERVVCTDEMKQAEFCTMEYAPVCGLVDVQCVTTPCDPIPETFGNGCQACAQGNVISYQAGACEA